MSRPLRFTMLAAAILIPACAQDTPAPAPLPPAMQSALNRIVTGIPSPVPEFRGAPVPTCSVPLLEMHVDHPEQYTMRTAPPPAIDDRMPRAHAPAPPCAQAATTPPAPRP